MAQDKRQVDAITARDVDFAQWYTDVCKKAELIDYTSVKVPQPRGKFFPPRRNQTPPPAD